MDIKTEMARGKWKKLTKYKAREWARNMLLSALSVAYYRYEADDDFQALSEEEQELVIQETNALGEKMAKAIGGEYYTQ